MDIILLKPFYLSKDISDKSKQLLVQLIRSWKILLFVLDLPLNTFGF
jgi:hypothetical protein